MNIVDKAITYKQIFESEGGKKILTDLAEHCGMLRSSFNGDVNEFLLNEGRRNVFLYILSMTNIDLPALMKMMEDNRKERMNERESI